MAPGTGRGRRGERGINTSRDSNHAEASSGDAHASNAPKKVRGVARNLAAERAFAATKTKLRVEFAHGRPSGINRKAFVAEIGIVVRAYAPLQADNWSEISKEDKNELIHRILTKFDIDMSNSTISRYLRSNMSSRYNNHRYLIKTHFKKFSVEEARQNKHKNIESQEDWDFLCTLGSSNKFLNRSAKCTESRKKISWNHRGGSKSFVQHAYEENDCTLKETPKGRIELFHDTHFNSDKGGWCNPEAEIAYNKMVDLQLSNPEMSDAKICEQVLGKRPGYVKGFGFGPLPDEFRSMYRGQTSADNEALKSEVSRLIGIVESQNATILKQGEMLETYGETIQTQGALIEKCMALQARTEATLNRMEGSA